MILYVFYYPQISSTKRRLPASILSHTLLDWNWHDMDCSRSSAHILTGISLSLVGLLSKVRFFCQNWTSTVAMRSLHKFCVRLWLSLATSGTRYPAVSSCVKLFPAVLPSSIESCRGLSCPVQSLPFCEVEAGWLPGTTWWGGENDVLGECDIRMLLPSCATKGHDEKRSKCLKLDRWGKFCEMMRQAHGDQRQNEKNEHCNRIALDPGSRWILTWSQSAEPHDRWSMSSLPSLAWSGS